MNKLWTLTTAIAICFSQCAFAWDCWDQCPENEYLLCLAGDRRFLSEPVDLSMSEDGLDNQGEPKHLSKGEAPTSNLRGASPLQQQQDESNTHRQLDSTNFTYFQFKMYWAPGYCWQAEENERKWCMECQGDECDEDDYLWLETCDENDNEERQQFLYEPLPAFGGGRIKPYHDQSLCLERTRVNAHQLRSCSPLDNLNTTQIVVGFSGNGRFEMHPYGWDENSTTHQNGAKCINNHHHPKSEEIVRAEFCSSARKSRVSRWIVYNPVTLTSGSGGSGGGQGGGDGDPEVNPVGSDHCTASNPCPQCDGDCDEDVDCAGELVCFQREPGDAVPSCSGGEDSDSSTDYCIDPNWVPGQGSSPSPTAAPTPSPVAPTEEPTSEPTKEPTASPTSPPTASPTTTATTPSPTDPDTTDPPTATPTTASPTAFSTSSPTFEPTTSPTAAPTSSPTTAAPAPSVPTSFPEVEAVNGSFCTPTAPCPACYGDCDVDSDCQGELVCEQRDGGEMVTGCSGGEDSPSDTDYCVDLNAGTGGRAPVANPSPTSSPAISYSDSCSPTSQCAKCVGDCDADSDCSGSLICPNRNGGEPIPGCSGRDYSKTDYCVEP